MSVAVAPARSGRRGVVALVVVVALAVLVLVVAGRGDGGSEAPLGIGNTAPDGARALARLLEGRGTDVSEVDALDDARGGADRTVFVLAPDAYSADQLRTLARDTAGPLVLLQPDDAALTAVGAALVNVTDTLGVTGTVQPGCDDPAATAAGPVAFDAGRPYAGPSSTSICYSGGFARDDRVAVLGDPSGLTNRRLADTGVAALALNVLGSTDAVVWVRPGADAAGGPTGSIWTVLPDHALTAALWLLAVGLLLVLWRGRRLGRPVAEPLPVVVRADEVVRGRARLYQRAGDAPRAAAVLRAATTARVARRLGLSRRSDPVTVARAVSSRLGLDVPRGLVDPAPPADDEALLVLARDLTTFEDAVRRATTGRPAGWAP